MTATSKTQRVYFGVLYQPETGDLIDTIIDRLHDESPGSKCFDEDTIRFVLSEVFDEEND